MTFMESIYGHIGTKRTIAEVQKLFEWVLRSAINK